MYPSTKHLFKQIMKWEPIETAPKDGERILGYWSREGYQGGNTHEMAVVSWDSENEWWGLDVSSGECVEFSQWTPTHWTPIPNLPKL